MGVIQRQSIKQSLVNYIAVAFAAFSIVFIYPQDKETYGLARFVIDTSLSIVPFIMLGFNIVTVRFFPYFKDENKGHRGFLFFLLLVVFGGSLVYILLALIFKEQVYNIFAEKPEIYQQILPYLIPVAIIMAFFQLFYSYSSNFKRIAIPAVFQNLIKFSLPVLVLLFIWKKISVFQVVDGILLNYIVALIGIIIYVYLLGQLKLKPDFSLLTKSRVKEIQRFATFTLFSGIGSILAFRIDSIMITTLLDFERNGTFAIAAFIATAIAIPTNAIGQISAPIITESIKNNDMEHVKKLYQSSSINLLVVGLFLFVCIMASIEDLFSIMPKSEELQDGAAIVFLIGMAKVIDMGTSINNQIINYSKYYKFGFYAIILMAIFNIVTNLILIPRFEIIGAAAATFASLSLYNLVKLIFIQWRFKMQPFTLKTLWVVVISLIGYGIGVILPSTSIAILDILIKSAVIGSFYISVVLYFKISPEFQSLLSNVIGKLKK